MESLCFFQDRIFSGQILVEPEHRGLNFGDGLFETILYQDGQLKFVSDHLERLEDGCMRMGLRYPGSALLMNKMEALLAQWPALPKSRLKILVFRIGGGNYIASTNETEFILKMSPVADSSHSKVSALLIKEPLKLAGPVSMVKSVSSHIYTYAGILAVKRGAAEAIILNQWGRVCEGIHGNIFWRSSGQWYTPPIMEGCVAGVMRKNILKEERVIEKPCEPEELFLAEALYFSNVIRGKYICEQIIE